MAKIEITRRETCDIMLALTAIANDIRDEINSEISDDRREIVRKSLDKWENLHDSLKERLDSFDIQHI